MERGVRAFWGVRRDSRLRGNDVGGCGNDGGGCGIGGGLCPVRIHGGAALWDGLRLGGEIPAFAGMTWEGVGMTWEGVGYDVGGSGI